MELFEKNEPSFENTVPGPVLVDPPAEPIAPHAAPQHRLIFTGVGSEYFKIWAVNMALTIVTLSVYSAWAKVRRLRYFYANTSLAGATFDFHGAPMAILRGRIIALVVVILYTQSPKISLSLYGVVLVLVAAGFPWLYWRSLKFRLANTSYRGVRFGFAGTVGGCYAVLWLPIAMFLLLNLFAVFLKYDGKRPLALDYAFQWGLGYLLFFAALPYFYYRLRAYQHRGARFGNGVFHYHGNAGPFYLIVLVAIIVMTALTGTLFFFGYLYFKAHGNTLTPNGNGPSPAVIYGIVVFVGLIYFAALSLLPFVMAAVQNVVWRATSLNAKRFASDLVGWRLGLIQLSNVLMMLITAGIFWPVAMIRSSRAKLQAVSFLGDPAVFATSERSGIGATGSEFTEMIGFDISL